MHRALATPYVAFVRIRKGMPSGQMWHTAWQVETGLDISPDWPAALRKAQPDHGLHVQLPSHCVLGTALALGCWSLSPGSSPTTSRGDLEADRPCPLTYWVGNLGSELFDQKSPPLLQLKDVCTRKQRSWRSHPEPSSFTRSLNGRGYPVLLVNSFETAARGRGGSPERKEEYCCCLILRGSANDSL